MNTRTIFSLGVSALVLGGTMVGCTATGNQLAKASDPLLAALTAADPTAYLGCAPRRQPIALYDDATAGALALFDWVFLLIGYLGFDYLVEE